MHKSIEHFSKSAYRRHSMPVECSHAGSLKCIAERLKFTCWPLWLFVYSVCFIHLSVRSIWCSVDYRNRSSAIIYFDRFFCFILSTRCLTCSLNHTNKTRVRLLLCAEVHAFHARWNKQRKPTDRCLSHKTNLWMCVRGQVCYSSVYNWWIGRFTEHSSWFCYSLFLCRSSVMFFGT